jgi:hypothetical protein
VDLKADLLNQRATFKTKLLTSLWEKLNKQLYLKDNTAVSRRKQ